MRHDPKTRRGSATLAGLTAVVLITGLCGAMLFTTLGTTRERNATVERHRAVAVADSGVSHAVLNLVAGDTADIGSAAAPVALAGQSYWVQIVEDDDGFFTVTSTGRARGTAQAVEAVVAPIDGGIFDNAIFAGNRSGDPDYTLELGGRGAQADEVRGDVYSGGDAELADDAQVTGTVRATGGVNGAPGEEGITQPLPDLQSEDYANTADYDVAALFDAATWERDNAGGSAWQLPESNPAHVFRKNPSDRSTETSSTQLDDYFLEDPYEPVRADRAQDGSNAFPVTLGPDGDGKVFFVDGNLWIHNRRSYSLIFEHAQADGLQVTFVVRGNIYFSDNLFYQNNATDGVVFIAMENDSVQDSGNIYFGDPVFGTLQEMHAFMYAENDFHDVNLDADGSSQVHLYGNMTAGEHVLIERDYGDAHTKLVVDFDDRIAEGLLDMPGLPGFAGAGQGGFTIASWRFVAPLE